MTNPFHFNLTNSKKDKTKFPILKPFQRPSLRFHPRLDWKKRSSQIGGSIKKPLSGENRWTKFPAEARFWRSIWKTSGKKSAEEEDKLAKEEPRALSTGAERRQCKLKEWWARQRHRQRQRTYYVRRIGGVQNGTCTPVLDRPHRACLEPSKFDLEERKSFPWAHNILFQNGHFWPVQNGLFWVVPERLRTI